MNRADAYSVLSRELAACRQLGYQRLVTRVDEAPIVRDVAVGGETITIETRVLWKNTKRNDIRIKAVAFGPSTWRLERLEEELVVTPDLVT